MAFRVFYAWQSDRPNSLCRTLIRRSLEQAAKELNANLDIEDAHREVLIDQDTQGVPGSPPLAETILQKIRECDVFVPDLTFIPNLEGTRSVPNPNVLIEYGYALGILGNQRIVSVFNKAFGRPADLPFDIRHNKWPIQYEVSDESDDGEAILQRKSTREELGRALTKAIRTAMESNYEVDGRSSNSKSIPPDNTKENPEGESVGGLHPLVALSSISDQYPWNDGVVGVRETISPEEPGYQVKLLKGSSIFLRLKSRNQGAALKNAQTAEVVKDALYPLAAHRASSWSYVRNRNGVASVVVENNDVAVARSASLLTRSGEIYGVDRHFLQVGRTMQSAEFDYVPTGVVEDILIHGLRNYLLVAKDYLDLKLPLEVAAGLEGVEGYRLAVKPQYFDFSDFAGHIFNSTIGDTFYVDSYDRDPLELLTPLFEKIFDEAGLVRPSSIESA